MRTSGFGALYDCLPLSSTYTGRHPSVHAGHFIRAADWELSKPQAGTLATPGHPSEAVLVCPYSCVHVRVWEDYAYQLGLVCPSIAVPHFEQNTTHRHSRQMCKCSSTVQCPKERKLRGSPTCPVSSTVAANALSASFTRHVVEFICPARYIQSDAIVFTWTIQLTA